MKLWLFVFLAAVLIAGVVGGSIMALDQHPASARMSPGGTSSQPSSAKAPAPLSVVAVAPAAGSKGVGAESLIAVRFSGAVDATRGFPTLSPPVQGSWTQPADDELVFLPDEPMAPFAEETLTVTPVGPDRSGVRGADGGSLSAPFTAQWRAGAGSTLRLQQVLAQLGYLPLSFQPTTPVPDDTRSQVDAAYQPPSGAFSWRWPDTPAALLKQWQAGSYGVMTQAAIMAFESDRGMATDGQAGPQVWAAILAAGAAPVPSMWGYSFVEVTKTVPQHLVLWHNGVNALTTNVNTGVAGAATPSGMWPVYARYASTTMTGTDTDGAHYSDPGVPFVNYFLGGDAVHGFTRAQYGYPQSNGCVELPLAAARTAFGLLRIGSLVQVTD